MRGCLYSIFWRRRRSRGWNRTLLRLCEWQHNQVRYTKSISQLCPIFCSQMYLHFQFDHYIIPKKLIMPVLLVRRSTDHYGIVVRRVSLVSSISRCYILLQLHGQIYVIASSIHFACTILHHFLFDNKRCRRNLHL